MPRSKTALLICLSLIIAFLAGVGGCASEKKSSDGIPIGPYKGKLAPDFSLISLDGAEVTLSQLKGKPVLLIFWATWCSECRKELEYWKTASADYAETDLVILAIDVGESESEVRDFVSDRGINVTVLLDSKKKAAGSYYVRSYPRNFFIDREGFVRLVVPGRFTYDSEWDIQLQKIL